MRKDEVDALISHAKSDLEKIEGQYSKALKETSIPSALQVDIKNYMENLRSGLDYIAHDIYEQKILPHRVASGKTTKSKIYFPYGRTENDFKSRVGANLPELKDVSNDLYDTLQSIQPYKLRDNWLVDFCNTVNENKHDTLTPQKKEEKRGLEIDLGGAGIKMSPGASISGTGTISSGQGSIHIRGESISGDTPARHTSGHVKQTITRWISFKFADSDVEVLPLLKKALSGIEGLSSEVYRKL